MPQRLLEPASTSSAPRSPNRACVLGRLGRSRVEATDWLTTVISSLTLSKSRQRIDNCRNPLGEAERVGLVLSSRSKWPHRLVAHIPEVPATIGGRSGRRVTESGKRPERQARHVSGPARSRAGPIVAALNLGLVRPWRRAASGTGAQPMMRVTAPCGPPSTDSSRKLRPLCANFEHGRDRRLEIGYEPRPGDLRHAFVVRPGKSGEIRLDR